MLKKDHGKWGVFTAKDYLAGECVGLITGPRSLRLLGVGYGCPPQEEVNLAADALYGEGMYSLSEALEVQSCFRKCDGHYAVVQPA